MLTTDGLKTLVSIFSVNFRVVFKTADKGVEFYSARKRSGILKTAYFFAVRRQIGSAVFASERNI